MAEWRSEQEAKLADPNVPEEDKRFIAIGSAWKIPNPDSPSQRQKGAKTDLQLTIKC